MSTWTVYGCLDDETPFPWRVTDGTLEFGCKTREEGFLLYDTLETLLHLHNVEQAYFFNQSQNNVVN